MEHDTPGFARILTEYGSVSWDFRATTRLFSRSEWKRSDSFHSDSVELMTPLMTPIFDFIISLVHKFSYGSDYDSDSDSLVKTSLLVKILVQEVSHVFLPPHFEMLLATPSP